MGQVKATAQRRQRNEGLAVTWQLAAVSAWVGCTLPEYNDHSRRFSRRILILGLAARFGSSEIGLPTRDKLGVHTLEMKIETRVLNSKPRITTAIAAGRQFEHPRWRGLRLTAVSQSGEEPAKGCRRRAGLSTQAKSSPKAMNTPMNNSRSTKKSANLLQINFPAARQGREHRQIHPARRSLRSDADGEVSRLIKKITRLSRWRFAAR